MATYIEPDQRFTPLGRTIRTLEVLAEEEAFLDAPDWDVVDFYRRRLEHLYEARQRGEVVLPNF